ncbi:MAG: chloride channel protein [Planctomycetes bacterium]|nr:chloride channel protein [Planctomycetota bacterium]
MMTLLSEWAAETYRILSVQFPWFHFVIPPVGMGFTAWLTFRFFPGSERSGIPQVKAALEFTHNPKERSELISLKIAFGKMFLPIMGLLSGASVGFGGPAVHVGAAIMLSLGKAIKFPPHYVQNGLILAGSAAGFAAMFSTPLAGIIFAIEEMGRTLEERISSLVLTAIIFSGITAYALLNSYIYFEDESLIMPMGKNWLAVPLCGFVGGFLGGIFSKMIVLGSALLKRTGISIVVIAIACGGVVAIDNYFSNGATVGTGYQQTKAILHGLHSIDAAYPFLKMLATCATFFSGIPSGIFVPSLATGAGFGVNLAHWFPIAPASAMILLCMTAYFSGMLQSPLTSFVLVMEMTNSHEILIPLMATAFVASGTSKLINSMPLYLAMCEAYKPQAIAKE